MLYYMSTLLKYCRLHDSQKKDNSDNNNDDSGSKEGEEWPRTGPEEFGDHFPYPATVYNARLKETHAIDHRTRDKACCFMAIL